MMIFLYFFIGMLAVYFFVWAWRIYPGSKMRKLKGVTDELEKAKLENEYRSTATQVAGSLIVALGLVVGFGQLQIAQRSTEAAVKSADFARESAARIQALQAFNQGFELLGKGSPAERIGGIYTLQSAMDTLPERKKAIIDALLTFVRSKPFDIGNGRCEDIEDRKAEEEPDIAMDVQIALDVILRSAKDTIADLDLSRIDLKRANFSGVDLRGIIVNLSYSDVSGAHLANTKFSNLRLYCTNLYGADLSEIEFDSRWTKESEFQLVAAKLWNANLNNAHLRGADFHKAQLGGARLCNVDLKEANLKGADLGDTVVEGADFKGAKVEGAIFTGVEGTPKSFDVDAGGGPRPELLPLADGSKCGPGRPQPRQSDPGTNPPRR